LNRSPFNRANQNGPEEQGFRGNARNLDLNRDFVKMDSRNARSLARVIHAWDPDVFIDTHSTNGADYPYTVTLIPSHHQQLEEPQSSFLRETMEPALYKAMEESPYKMSPYVNVFRRGPEQGFEGFYLYPRYLAGYTSIFHILSFTVETHMLKPYPERVLSTKYLLNEMLNFTSRHAETIKENKERAIEVTKARQHHVLQWYNDKEQYDVFFFNGYRAKNRKSNLTGHDILYYDRDDPWQEMIPFYNYFLPHAGVMSPEFYILPSAWEEVVSRLKCSNIEMVPLENDTSLMVEIYYIEDFQTTGEPYNGHYWHYATRVRKDTGFIKFLKGDFLIPVAQRGASFITQTLEPQGYDSFFSWNFFDAVLSRKEYFSDYLFEETARSILENDPGLMEEFLSLKSQDSTFAANPYAQLNWIYDRSEWSEPTYRRYPVYRYNRSVNY
jgi:hypothetical protein